MLNLALFFGLSAQAWSVKENSAGEPLRWGIDAVEFWVNPAGSPGLSETELDAAVAQCVAQWHEVYPDEVQLIYKGFTSAVRKVDYTDDMNVIFFEDVWSEDLDPSLLGVTWVWSIDGGEITNFDIEVNTEHHRWSTDGANGTNDFANMLTHELGHALGLGHSEAHSATMSATTWPGELDKRTLDTDDRAGAAWLYSQPLPEPVQIGGCAGQVLGSELALAVPGIFLWGLMRRRRGAVHLS
jgi:hypothetical protein